MISSLNDNEPKNLDKSVVMLLSLKMSQTINVTSAVIKKDPTIQTPMMRACLSWAEFISVYCHRHSGVER